MKKFIATAALLCIVSIAYADNGARGGSPRGGDSLVALEELKAAAVSGDAKAQVILGYLHETGERVTKDDAEATRLYRMAADKGSAGAQVFLGLTYQKGRGVPKNDAEAVRWYRLAADQGDATGQLNLAAMYANGQGVPKNDAEAVRWYRLAADQGNADAQGGLGLMYLYGRGVPQNDAEAFRWYRLAADKGNARAQYDVGVMHLLGRGVVQNDAEALRWFRMAADQGEANALNNIGAMYANGRAVDKNFAWAVFYFAQAARLGDEIAANNIPSKLERLTKKTVKASKAVVRAGRSDNEKVLAQVNRGTAAYVLATEDGWHEVYLQAGHVVGWLPVSALQEVPKAAAAAPSSGSSPFPPAPARQPGVVSCNTRCINGDCYRTYASGKKVRFQAERRYNPLSSQWEWDSGGC